MTDSTTTMQSRIIVWLKRVFIVSVIGMFAGITLILLLPSLLSTPYSQNLIQRQLSSRLNRPVSWKQLDISWAHGCAIRELTLGTGPAPLRTGTVGEAVMISRCGYAHGRFRLDLNLRITNVAVQMEPGPPQPPKPFKEPLNAIAEALQRVETIDWPLPIDLGITMAVDPVNLRFTDPKSGRTLVLNNSVFHFDMPSLADQPVTTELSGDLAVDGRQESLSVKADVKGLVTTTRHIRPAGMVIAMTAALPGTTVSVQGGLQEPKGVAATARFNLPHLIAVAGPFLPPTAPKLQGEVTFDLQATADPSRNLTLVLALNGSGLSVSGGKLGKGRIGPLDVHLGQTIVSDHQRQQVRFNEGSVVIGTLMTGKWEAVVDRPSHRDRDLSLQLGPLQVDLRQAKELAAPFLSPRFPLQEISGELLLKQLTARVSGQNHQGELALAGLGITMPHVRLALARGVVSAEGVDVAIDQATMPLMGRQLAKLDARLSYGVRKCSVTGDRPLRADALRGALQLALTDLNLKSRSPRKISATLDLKQSLDLQRLRLEKKLSVDTLHEQLTARIHANDSGEIELSIPELKVSAAAVEAVAGGKQLTPLPLSADLSAEGVRVPPVKGSPIAVRRAACSITSGDALKLYAAAGLSGSVPQLATTTGSLSLDLQRMLPLAAPFLPRGVTAAGVSSLSWDLAAPVMKEQKKGSDKNPLRTARAALAQLDKGEITLALANRAISWPLSTDTVKIGEVRTTQPIRLNVSDKGSKIAVDGAISFTGLSGIPGKAGQLQPQNGSFLLRGELADWQSLKLHEEVHLKPLGLLQQADATISRISGLLETPNAITFEALLQRLDAQLSTEVTASFPATLTPVPGGIELSGETRAGVSVNLAGGRELRFRGTATARDSGFRLKNGTRAEGVRADILFERTFALAKKADADWTPLSVSLIRPVPGQLAAPGAAELVSRVREDLRGQQRGSRKFTIRRVTTFAGRTPLELTSLEGDLLLTPEEMGLGFFQAELLGGTIRLRSLIDLKPVTPSVSASCSFSNLETFLLLSPETRKQSAPVRQDTEITGEMSFDAPLLTGQRALLEGIRMRLNLRKIGADTLERALFGLDPSERNEQLVAQRKMLRNGRLKNLQANALDGSFSLNGELQVKGVDVSLPRVERIRLSELAIQKQMAKTVAGVTATRKVLELMRADTLVVGTNGKIEFVRRGLQ